VATVRSHTPGDPADGRSIQTVGIPGLRQSTISSHLMRHSHSSASSAEGVGLEGLVLRDVPICWLAATTNGAPRALPVMN
jgi:hypothetical protein